MLLQLGSLHIHLLRGNVFGRSHPALILDLTGDLSVSGEVECRGGSEEGEVGEGEQESLG